MPEPAKTAIPLVATCFAVAALWILTAQATGRLRGRRIWTTYFVEILVLAAIFAPLFAGPSWFAAAIAVIGLVCCFEVARALAKPVLVLLYPGIFLLFLWALG